MSDAQLHSNGQIKCQMSTTINGICIRNTRLHGIVKITAALEEAGEERKKRTPNSAPCYWPHSYISMILTTSEPSCLQLNPFSVIFRTDSRSH